MRPREDDPIRMLGPITKAEMRALLAEQPELSRELVDQRYGFLVILVVLLKILKRLDEMARRDDE